MKMYKSSTVKGPEFQRKIDIWRDNYVKLTGDYRLEKEKVEEQLQLFPFGQGALKEIIRLSQGNLGEAIKLCNVVLDKAAGEEVDVIDGKTLLRLTPEFQR